MSGRWFASNFPTWLDEVVEAAAEAGAGDLLHVEALRAQRVGIDEILRLVVGDDADLVPAVGVVAGEAGKGGRLARTEEATEHDEADTFHGAATTG